MNIVDINYPQQIVSIKSGLRAKRYSG